MAWNQPFVGTIEKINQLGDFGRKYTWNIMFSNFNYGGSVANIPPRFAEWIPVHSCEIGLSSIDNFDVTGGVLSTAVPKTKQVNTLNVSLYDTYAYEFSVWMFKWRRLIITNEYTLPVCDACAKCSVVCYDSTGKNIRLGVYYVFPTAEHQAQFDSSGDVYDTSFEFTIAGREQDIFDSNDLF